MARNRVEAWECGECGVHVDSDVLFAWCDGCGRALCVSCLEAATTCDICDVVMCRHCSPKAFAVECSGCGKPMHVDCFSKSKRGGAHVLCDGCCRSATAMWGHG